MALPTAPAAHAPLPTRTMGPLQYLLIMVCGAAVLAASFVRDLLPERFLLDDSHLQRVIADPGVTPEDESFQTVAAFYRALGFEHFEGLAATVAILVLVLCLCLAIRFEDWGRIGAVGLMVLALTVGLGIVYLAQYTKEFFSVLLVLGVLIGLRFRSVFARCAIVLGLSLGYGLLLRPYWLLIAVLIGPIAFVLCRIRNPLVVLLGVVITFAGLEIAFELLRGEHLGATREWVNLGRVDTEVATLITTPELGGSTPARILSILVVFAQLIVPVPLLAGAGPYYLASGMVILGLWAVVSWAIVRGRCLHDSRAALIVAVLLSLVIVQAVFEPDYGSYMKHLAPFLPLFLALVPRRSESESDVRHPSADSSRTPAEGAVR